MKNTVLLLGDSNRAKSWLEKRYPGEYEYFEEADPKDKVYDVVILDHLLCQGKRRHVHQIIQMYRECLTEGGRMIVMNPSLEWACRMIALNDNPPQMAYFSIYGDDENPFLSGTTLLWLRALMEANHFRIETATPEIYTASIGEDKENATQLVVIGVKATPDPREAIG